MEQFKRRIKRYTIEGLGEVFIKAPSAGLARRVAAIANGQETDTDKGFKLLAEGVASCLCNEAGVPVFENAEAALEMDSDAFQSVSSVIIGQLRKRPSVEQAEKNSGSVPS